MLSPLSARESMVRINELAYVNGNLREDRATEFISGLEASATRQQLPPGRRAGVRRPGSLAEMQRLLGATKSTKVVLE